MKTHIKKHLLFIFSLCLIINQTMVSYGGGSEFALPENGGVHPMFQLREEEEKIKLSDNLIEWDEIDKIIRDYNPEVRNAWNGYQTNQNNSDINEHYMDMADRFDALANSAASDAQEAMFQAQSYAMQINADNNVSDSLTQYYSCIQLEKMTILNTRTYFINYYKNQLAHEIAVLTEEEAERELKSAENKYSLGSITKVDALNAKVNYFSKQSNTILALSNLNQTKQNLLISVGKDYKNPDVIIGIFPMIDFNIVTLTNPEMDKINAVDNNLQFKTYQRNLNNAQTAAVISKYQLLVDDAPSYIKSDIDTKFRAVKDSMNSLMLSQQKSMASNDDFSKIASQYKLGSVSKREYKTAEFKKQVAQKEAQIAYYDFAIIYYTYLAAVDGLASASAN